MTSVRDMFPSDVPRVVEIERNLFDAPWTAEDFVSMIALGCHARVVEDDGHVTGFCLVRKALDEAEVYDIGVDAAFQGRGLGRLLMEDAIDAMRRGAVARMFLEVRVGNAPARGLYKSLGFKEVGLRKGYYRSPAGVEDAVVMAGDLLHGS